MKTLREIIKVGLFADTLKRYPEQVIPGPTQTAWLDDWAEIASNVGMMRFETGIRQAWRVCHFFPKIDEIMPLIPEPPMKDGERWMKELRYLEAQKAAGVQFYNLADVFTEFCRRVENGEIKGRDERGQESLEIWAKKFRGSEKEYAEKCLAESR